MAEYDSDEKTEEPTQTRRDEFRKRGEVAQSKELASVLMMFGAAFGLWTLSRFFLVQITDIFNLTFTDYFVSAAREGAYREAAIFAAKKGVLIIAPIFGIFGILAFASSVIQVGFLTNEEALQLKIERLNPVEGFKRLFSIKSVVEGLKATLKVTLVATIAWFILKNEIKTVPLLVYFSISQLLVYVGEVVLRLIMGIGVFMAVIAGLDYMFQRWQLEKKMKMTKQELKEEMKSREGDPLIKARIRKIQRELANKRMMADVPKADVIVTNPTHLAVALQYTAEMAAPVVLAMGADVMAAKIREIAKENNIPIVENKPLARTMYKTLKIGQVVPRELYTAVAEVLSYVFKLKRKQKGRV